MKKVSRSSPAIELLERGIKYLHEKEYKSARSCFQDIVEKHSEEKDIVVRAESYLKTCEMRLLSRKPSGQTTEDFYNLGIIRHNQEEYDEAIELFNEAQRLNPKADHVYYALAASYAMKNAVEAVIENLDRAIKLNKDNAVYAKSDPDFDSVKEEKEFKDLVAPSSE